MKHTVTAFDATGYAQEVIPSNMNGVSFSLCSLQAGCSISPALEAEKLVVLLFDGHQGYITAPGTLYSITEPSAFAPDFLRTPYTVHAVEEIKFLMCILDMNEWDRKFYDGWHLHFPFFSTYSNGVRYDQAGQSGRLSSWSLIQPFQIGHLSLSVIRGLGGGALKSPGNQLQNQWFYSANASYHISIGGAEQAAQSANELTFVPAGTSFHLEYPESSTGCVFCISVFVEADIQKYYLAQIFNGRLTEAR